MRIQDWNKKFQELLDEMPDGYWLFASGNRLHLMKLGNDGKRVVEDRGGMSQKAIVKSFDCTNDIDGGDW